MLDIQQIRRHPEQVQENFERRGLDISVEDFLGLDKEKLRLQTELQEMTHEKNLLSKQVAARKKQGREAGDLLMSIYRIEDKLDELGYILRAKTQRLQDALLRLPNLLDDEMQADMEVLYSYKEKPVFGFQPKGHMELCRRHRLIDYETAATLMGRGYWIYRGVGARLEWALLDFCLEENQKAGYEMVMLPPIAREICGFGAGQFPKFEEEAYKIQGNGQFLIPTAETVLVNLHRDKILKSDEFPLKYTSYTSCFRREVSKDPDERGMIRGHHFNKVENVQFVAQEQSEEAFAQILRQAEHLMQTLDLHYRVIRSAAGECSTAMSKTYDIEVWLPAERVYKEVSSISNARDYQARRTNTRYRDESGKLRYVHTLNGSGLATSRLFAAILEQNQLVEDGSIRIPEVLAPRVGIDVLSLS